MHPLPIASVFCLAVAILFLRAPDALWAPQFWGEDATLFWLHQHERGFLASVGQPYAGYLHFAPRLIALFASAFPFALEPAVYVAAAAIGTGWTAATIASVALPRVLAALLGLAAILVAPGEILASPVNLQWIMAAGLPVIAATAPPDGRFARANQLGFVTLSGLSGPFSVLMLPFWLWRAASGRTRFDLLLAGFAALTGLAQAAALAGSREAAAPNHALGEAMWTIVLRAAAEPFGTERRLAALVFVAAVLGWAVATGQFRRQRAVFVGFGVLSLAAFAWKYGNNPVWLPLFGGAIRYLHPATAMLSFCALTMLFERSAPAIVGATACLMLGWTQARSFVREPPANFARDWTQASPLIGTRDLEVTISPGWPMRIPAGIR